MTILNAYLDEHGLLRLKEGERVLNVKVAVHSVLQLQKDFGIDAIAMTVAGVKSVLAAQGITDVTAEQLTALITPHLKEYVPPKADLPEAPKTP